MMKSDGDIMNRITFTFYFLATCFLFAASIESSKPDVKIVLGATNLSYRNENGLRANHRHSFIIRQRRERCRSSNDRLLAFAFSSLWASLVGSRFIHPIQRDNFHSAISTKNHFRVTQQNIPSMRETNRNKLTRLQQKQSQDQLENNKEQLHDAIENLASMIDSLENLCPGNDSSSTKSPSRPTHTQTTVHIIGTGLTPTLMSLPLSTLLLLSKADVVLYDSLGLSHNDIFKVVPKHCEVIYVGKRGDSKKSWKQSDIDELILRMALGGTSTSSASSSTSKSSNARGGNQSHSSNDAKCIIRLKGGDPFLFGRTRTEIENLRANNIAYTYTPNISSCIAAPHLGGIPLTDALLNCQSFGVWSGTDAFGKSIGMDSDCSDELGFTRDGLSVDTLVFLMIGRLDKLEGLCNSLIKSEKRDGDMEDGGNQRKWDANTPCAVIQNAGGRNLSRGKDIENYCSSIDDRPIQKVWRSTLGKIVSDIRNEDDTIASVSPAVFIVGATCELDLLAD